MKKSILISGASLLLALGAQAQSPTALFTPGKLIVLQEGDGGPGRGNANPSDFASKQNPIFIDQFDPNTPLQTVPSAQVAIPTNGSYSLWLNGNAGTEGGLSLAGDKSMVCFTGYCGDIDSIQPDPSKGTAPSNVSYDRGIGAVNAFGIYSNYYRGGDWYGIATGKTNPRGVATDGTNQFWGCGNGYGSMYFDASSGFSPSPFQNVDLTSYIRVQNNAVYSTVKSGDVQNSIYPAGLYSFVDFYNNPVPYPQDASYLN